ncbi:hypothetical protein ACFQ1E_20755 [Sphingomonas canadensis]|uniref:Uncharacterized protein n=1 Tax=Sphingomonas canadensis TaxID=1219257 RepID=A0ABW3HBA2_9SPHN|nr:hypothetical protein [Sphingomonas canadensis]MCW3838473.1 hypothetical protein [Sphingomonas canadensis]
MLLFGSRSEIGTFGRGNWLAAQEREVGVLMNAEQFSAKAPFSFSADSAREILADMGMPALPRSVASPSVRSTLIDAAPKMTPAQIAEFMRRAN